MRLLLDEHISPSLVARLAEVGIYAQSVPHAGLPGRADHEIWQYALDHDFAVVLRHISMLVWVFHWLLRVYGAYSRTKFSELALLHPDRLQWDARTR